MIIEIKFVIIEKDCDKQKFSGNINEVIKAVLNSYYYYFFFFYEKILHALKSTKSTKSTKRHKDTWTKAQKRK